MGSAPTADHAGLDVTEDKKGQGHDADGDVETVEDLVDEEVRKEGDEASEEVAHGDGESGGEGAVRGGLEGAVVELHEEINDLGGRGQVVDEALKVGSIKLERLEYVTDVRMDGNRVVSDHGFRVSPCLAVRSTVAVRC